MGLFLSKANYKNGTPTFKGATQVYPMFNGLLFRLCDPRKKRWGFYNDSPEYTMHVAILFKDDSHIVPLGSATLHRTTGPENGKSDKKRWHVVEVDIAPLTTEMFVEGQVTGWDIDTLEARTSTDGRVFRLREQKDRNNKYMGLMTPTWRNSVG
ncbi:calpain-like protein [Trypanosoma rangeli]|uniref:Calpain-like protein n=1 Tax=Trypanosoma rangeli TaxID=5698 RepID=A0A422N058_TRYRA|nr:calpain-like protein [Trypanosoma rangeli]RNE98820.1 calpain-like protein [Trypanosoma rangeli]|eukprot:RNE98820.1 calpain-like protein [Trypanosoma rangeli]